MNNHQKIGHCLVIFPVQLTEKDHECNCKVKRKLLFQANTITQHFRKTNWSLDKVKWPQDFWHGNMGEYGK